MIDRYTTPAMNAIWSRQAKYQRWMDVEIAIVEAHADLGAVPREAVDEIKAKASFDIARCDEIEKETRHDLMAFVRNLSENVSATGFQPVSGSAFRAGLPYQGQDGLDTHHQDGDGTAARFIHMGVTSYDVIDTALGIMLRDSCDVLIASAGRLGNEIARLAKEHEHTPEIGRTHGIHAEPITFGFKCANWYAELSRNIS
jgi:adenylosuccinate lyase